MAIQLRGMHPHKNMTKNLILAQNGDRAKFEFPSNTIRKDGMVNATALTTAYRNATGVNKQARDWLKTATAQESVAFLAAKINILAGQLVIVENGVGTWLHPDLAEIFAQWVSVEYRFAVVDLIRQEKTKSEFVTPAQTQTDKEIRLQELKLQTAQLVGDLSTIHGKELAMAAIGMSDCVVKVETVVTEIVNPATRTTDKILSADQLKRAVAGRTGQKLKTMAAAVDKLRAKGRDDLLVAVTRHQTSQYIKADKLDEALEVLYGRERQELIKPIALQSTRSR